LSKPSSFFTDLNYKYFDWWEGGIKLGSGAKLPEHIPKYLQGIDPKWLLKSSVSPKSLLNPKDWLNHASVSLTGFFVFDWDVFGGDWIDRNLAAGEMFGATPSVISLNVRNVMMSELLDFGDFGR
jgi:hypothetical protein